MNRMDMSARCLVLETDLARLRASHDALLAAAKDAHYAIKYNGEYQKTLDLLQAAIAKAEELAP